MIAAGATDPAEDLLRLEPTRGWSVDGSLLQPRPFDGDDEYWALVAARFTLRHRWIEVHRELAEVTARTWGPEEPGLTDGGLRATARSLRRALAHLSALHDECLVAQRDRAGRTADHASAPRMVRVARRAELSPPETDVLHYLVLVLCDGAFGEMRGLGDPRGHACSVGDLAFFLGLEAADVFGLLEEARPLRRHGLVSIESRSALRPPEVQADTAVLKALRGLPLTADDRFALANGLFEAIISQETGQPPLGRTATPESTTSLAPPCEAARDEPDALEPEGPFEIEALLRGEGAPEPCPASDATGAIACSDPTPYGNDVEYLSDHLELFKARFRWKSILFGPSYQGSDDGRKPETRLREAQAQERVLRSRIAERLALTREHGEWEPRAERLARTRGLDEFEKHVLLLLVGSASSFEFRKAIDARGSAEVGELLLFFHDTFESQVGGRRHFYRSAPLVRDGLLTLGEAPFGRDLLRVDVEIDRRVAEYLLGVEGEASSIIEGTHLYSPGICIDRVVLPESEKDLVVRTVEHFPQYREERRRSGLDDLVPYGNGIVLLFHGPSGTGKTMLANALAHHLRKKLLLVNFPTIGTMNSDQSLRFLFREARLHDAVLFFDECDGVFEDRQGNAGLSLILTEMERHDGLIILATNRPFRMDESMQRRVTLAVPFHPPDAAHRERIWRAHVPTNLRLEGTPDFAALAFRYELTGGLIKNAVLAAVSRATAREGRDPRVRPDDFEEGARLQLRTRLGADAGEQLSPRAGLNNLVVPAPLRRSLAEIVGLEKARRTLVGQWGFGDLFARGMGTTALFHGAPGTGKTLAAEAMAFELGRPVRRVNAAQLVSKWVGEGAKNLETVFREARQAEAVLVFDEADALFGTRTAVGSATDRYSNLEVSVLLRELESFPGVAILTSNLVENLDPAFRRRLRFVLEFQAPDATCREELWRMHLPASAPYSADVDPRALARDFDLTGAQIRNAVVKAAATAALRADRERVITQQDLASAAESEGTNRGEHRIVGFQRPA